MEGGHTILQILISANTRALLLQRLSIGSSKVHHLSPNAVPFLFKQQEYDNGYIGDTRKPPSQTTSKRDSDETQCTLPRKTVRHGQKKIAPIRLVRPNKTSLVAGTGIEPVTS